MLFMASICVGNCRKCKATQKKHSDKEYSKPLCFFVEFSLMFRLYSADIYFDIERFTQIEITLFKIIRNTAFILALPISFDAMYGEHL